jgi:hypothetical protein
VYVQAYTEKRENHYDLLDALHSVHFSGLPIYPNGLKFWISTPEYLPEGCSGRFFQISNCVVSYKIQNNLHTLFISKNFVFRAMDMN